MFKKLKHIFLVDDDEDDQLFFLEALQKVDNSIKFTYAENGKKALSKLSELVQLPDIIFMDINMPELNGFECLKELKKCARLRTVPVVMLSTSVSLHDMNQSKELGAEMFYTKPSSYSKLRDLLQKIISQS
ncbi:MAG TPA: response regulator [Bacteroidia bacterium]|nr:response regulator [Bacteroidia bacterium]